MPDAPKPSSKPVFKNIELQRPHKRKRDDAPKPSGQKKKSKSKHAPANDEPGHKHARNDDNDDGNAPTKAKAKAKANSSANGHGTVSNGGDEAVHTPSSASAHDRNRAAFVHARTQLPIWPHADAIRAALSGGPNEKASKVLVLSGETGSGKSTQVPQFLEAAEWCRGVKVSLAAERPEGTDDKGNVEEENNNNNKKKKKNKDKDKDKNEAGEDMPEAAAAEEESGPPPASTSTPKPKPKSITVGGCIAVTQPRRVAAVALARRVAAETGTALGSHVGYSVRFDSRAAPTARIKFVTEGMLLHEMLADPALTRYSTVVVDEVHERGVNVDLLLGFLRLMVAGGAGASGRGGLPLRVVVMSATADVGALVRFFEEGGAGAPAGSMLAPGTETSAAVSPSPVVSVCRVKGRQFPVRIVYAPEPVSDFVDAAFQTIMRLHAHEPLPGDILVFLTGQETVESLESLLNDHAGTIDKSLPRLLVLPLFAALPQTAQQRVFAPTPPRTRKVVLATNIAETSVTLSGVRHVVDCGKAKLRQFRTRLGLDSLLVSPISQSSAAQRAGRAGREAPGTCHRLYPQSAYDALLPATQPEILRTDLTPALLVLRARNVTDLAGFPFPTPPARDALAAALLRLLHLGALDPQTGAISDVGRRLARLPLPPTLGRVLVAAAEAGVGVLRDVVDVVAAVSVENVFVNPGGAVTRAAIEAAAAGGGEEDGEDSFGDQREVAEAARRDLFRREGDHLTLLAAVRGYLAQPASGGARKAWAEQRFLSPRAMAAVMVCPPSLSPLPLFIYSVLLTPSRMSANNSFPNRCTRISSPPTTHPPCPHPTCWSPPRPHPIPPPFCAPSSPAWPPTRRASCPTVPTAPFSATSRSPSTRALCWRANAWRRLCLTSMCTRRGRMRGA